MAAPIRLSQLSHGAGCACKLRPADLAEVLRGLRTLPDPRALVGHQTSDDAAVYRLNATQAVVETIDFFTPMVDDPYTFGQIAAANAISDIYAMGARPLFALNVVAFPSRDLPLRILREILRGGADKAAEASIAVLGGHSIDDPEPKYGMAVTGLVHPRRILTNAAARAGDVLVLTKPIGVGLISTGIKKGKASPAVAKGAIDSMRMLNRAAGEVLARRDLGVHALTDVTGFSLLGHLLEMCRGAHLGARLHLAAVPVLPGALELARRDVVPGGTRANLAWVAPHVRFPRGLSEPERLLLADAQTNGGLLAAVPPRQVKRVVAALRRAKTLAAAVIGEFVAGPARVVVD
jgi:selenide,water dikinase